MNIQTTIFERNNLGIGTAMAIVMGIVISVISVIQFLFQSRRSAE